MTEGVRRNEILCQVLEILIEANWPLAAGEVYERLNERFPLNDHERTQTASGQERAYAFLMFGTFWLANMGWMSKTNQGWVITEQGRIEYPASDHDDVYGHASRTYRQTRKTQSVAPSGSKPAVLAEALDLIPPGSWTSYGDLAQLAGMANQQVGGWTMHTDHTAAHRVLGSDGRVAQGFKWRDPTRTETPEEVLRSEGVEFDDSGHASQAQRITVEELRDLLQDHDGTPRRAWFVRGNAVDGKDLVPVWLDKGTISLRANRLRTLTLPVERATLAAYVEEDYSDRSYNARSEKLQEFDLFLNRVRVGDLIVTNDGGLFLGAVTGDVESLASQDGRSNLRRAVEWHNASDPVDLARTTKSFAALTRNQRDIFDVSGEIQMLESLIEAGSPSTTPPLEHRLADPSAELSEDLLIDLPWLERMVDLLKDRRQLILYGPPGTGKTYVAKKVAQSLTDDKAVKLVQFHPAYSYEDFFEGFRPTTSTDGTMTFALRPGPFRRLVDAAREDKSTAYILIIDEINRANLAKVFGELYFLLEYRDDNIDLLYGSGDDTGGGFTLPENVYVIATMNTADRSIALVDAAMRRRFAFLAMNPDEAPTKGLLRRWLERESLDATAGDLHELLNERIEDMDFKIGPSYFMRRSVHEDGGLDLVWETSILPLLEEHHFGEQVDVKARYGLKALRRVLEARAAQTVAAEPDAGTDEG